MAKITNCKARHYADLSCLGLLTFGPKCSSRMATAISPSYKLRGRSLISGRRWLVIARRWHRSPLPLPGFKPNRLARLVPRSTGRYFHVGRTEMSVCLSHSEVNGFPFVDNGICLDVHAGIDRYRSANIDCKLRWHQSPKVKELLESTCQKKKSYRERTPMCYEASSGPIVV